MRHFNYSINLCLIIIDEFHLMFEWKKIRSKYFNLIVLKVKLLDVIMFQTSSTTLNSQIMKTIKENCQFDDNTIVVKTILNWSKIYFQIIQFKEFMKNMLNLQCMFSRNVRHYLNMSKIIVFINFINDIKRTCALSKRWMLKLNYFFDFWKLIIFSFVDMTKIDKNRIQKRFEMLSKNYFDSRILFATNIYELKLNNSNVLHVFQWLIIKNSTLLKLLQRDERAMRKSKNQNYFVVFH